MYHDGKPVVDLWGGFLDANRTKPWNKNTLCLMYSLAKSICALSIHILADRQKLNLEKPVNITRKKGQDAQLKPIITEGKISFVEIQSKGKNYVGAPDLEVVGIGTGLGAKLRAVVENGKIIDVIILDGGVRRGTHVLKAIAAGAKACSFGKIFLFSLAAGGQQGVEHLLKNMHDEINRNMVLMGCKSLKELNSSKLIYRK